MGEDRQKLLTHLKRKLGGNSEFYLEFVDWNVECVNHTETIITFSSSSFESVGENYPLNRIVYLNDPKVLKEFKAILGRKKATIQFELDGDGIFVHYEYERIRKTGIMYLDKHGNEKERREKIVEKGSLHLGESVIAKDTEGFCLKHFDVLWRFSPLNGGDNVLPIIEREKEIPLTKFEFDVIQIDDVFFNKNDILKMLQIFKNDATIIYCEEDPAHGVAVFNSPEVEIDVFMTTVQEHKNENSRV